jgi:8-oxo-dGTP pyrophosphatase MutT (NUDIX family)
MKIKIKSTHCFLVKNDKVLLGMKKRGFGEGKWNGIGGKKDKKDKNIVDTFIRETEEEIKVTPLNYKLMAKIKFLWEATPEWNQVAYVFVTTKWKGKIQETEEERPKWWQKNKLPFDKMWEDDPSWLPFVLSGHFVKAKYLFGKNGKIKEFKIKSD